MKKKKKKSHQSECPLMVDWHSKMPGEPTAATFASAAGTFPSAAAAAADFSSVTTFEMPHRESLSQLSCSGYV
jgi:hypothetical protein